MRSKPDYYYEEDEQDIKPRNKVPCPSGTKKKKEIGGNKNECTR